MRYLRQFDEVSCSLYVTNEYLTFDANVCLDEDNVDEGDTWGLRLL